MAAADTFEFRLLGPFEVCRDGRSLDVGSGKQPALLALLLLRSGDVVSTDRLIDALWGERVPSSAANSVHIYVSRLRKALGNGRLETHGRGYLLRLEAEELDLARFERQIEEGRELLAGGDARRAAETLRAALALWRGRPLSDFTSEPFAQSEIARLEELRLSGLEERIEADLALGRHVELVPELEALVREHPFRERLRAQLMFALYRSGRQVDALAAYQQARATLREELGLEPGRRLQELERAILRQDVELDPPGRAARSAVQARRRSGALITIGAAVLLAAVAAIAGLQLAGGDDAALAAASANAVAAIDSRSNRIVADVPVGNGPASVAVGQGSVWVTNALDRTVSRIDPETGDVIRIDVGGDPSGIAVGAEAVWVANSLDGTLSRVDPLTNREADTIPVGVAPTAVAVADGVVWVTSSEERKVARIDAVTGRVLERIPTDALGRGIAVAGESIWVTDGSSRSVVRIDARRGSVLDTVLVGNGPTGIAFGEGSAWVANSLDGTVSRIDPKKGVVTATIPVGEGPDGIVVGAGGVWVSLEFSEELVRIDPLEDRVAERVPVANRPKGLAISEGRVWFAAQPSGVGHRGGRLLVDATAGVIEGSIDPSYWSWAGTITSLSAVYDGLVGYARRGGSEGSQIVPNLAVSLPTDTAGETRFAFRLRRGIRYSNGMPVRASDFRRAFERSVGTDLLVPAIPFEGAGACRPRSCDLSRGVVTDDETGTIVFRLTRPDIGFLRALTTVAPIPRGTPDRDAGTRPVPATGPYMIESYVPERALTLVRNPYFDVWSRIARPDGFPDEIEFRLGGPEAGISGVERGLVDIAGFGIDRGDVQEELDVFRARHPSRFHVHADRATVLAFLNTTKAPFDDVRVRRAVNYAVDRAAVSQAYGGATHAPPTCQLRAPDTVGFRRYCPYTAAPSRTGEWKAPDLTRARRLVAASGTQGTNVTLWTYRGFWESAAKGVADALEQLGFRVVIRRAADFPAYAEKVNDERTHGVQAGMIGWYGLASTGDSLLTLLRCTPPDLSFFCNDGIDARIEHALDLQAEDQDAAAALWTGIESDIVDLAPWVPLFTPSGTTLTSARVGNYQHNPETRLLFDQLWVR